MIIPWRETPVPISNTAVKLPGADGTIPAMEWESWLSRGFFISILIEVKLFDFEKFLSIICIKVIS